MIHLLSLIEASYNEDATSLSPSQTAHNTSAIGPSF